MYRQNSSLSYFADFQSYISSVDNVMFTVGATNLKLAIGSEHCFQPGESLPNTSPVRKCQHC
jgi:hypothetical protein